MFMTRMIRRTESLMLVRLQEPLLQSNAVTSEMSNTPPIGEFLDVGVSHRIQHHFRTLGRLARARSMGREPSYSRTPTSPILADSPELIEQPRDETVLGLITLLRERPSTGGARHATLGTGRSLCQSWRVPARTNVGRGLHRSTREDSHCAAASAQPRREEGFARRQLSQSVIERC